jgi:tetratricopeptide (TPR) repeat protein
MAVFLFASTALLYLPVLRFDFVNFDDPDYITNNAHVLKGVSTDGIVWALTSFDAANWLPLTRLSELIDVQLFSTQPGSHHAMNIFYHALATVCLFLFLYRATRSRWPSLFVTFVFGLHPLHVESVAWISERKDVLCALFFFLTLYAYVLYTERPSPARYAAAILAFALALLSKPMAVTLPVLLILMDYWPLRRSAIKFWKDKLAFFGLAVAASGVTFWVQHTGGAVRTLTAFPLELRVENAIVSYAVYALELVWPVDLAAYYPYPSAIPAWQWILGLVLLIALSALALVYRRTQPYFTFGWSWYLVTLLPVIGLVQVGAQSRADRYTYFTTTGLCIAIAWTAQHLVERRPRFRNLIAALAVGASIVLAIATGQQLQYWRNSEALFRRAVTVTDRNALAEHNLGVALAADPNRLQEAIEHYRAALRIEPNAARTHTDLGTALSQLPNRLPEAVAEYRAALEILPDAPIPHNNLANTLSRLPGGLPEAIAEYETALRLAPSYTEARANLAIAHASLGLELAKSGRAPEAVRELEAALKLNPGDAVTHNTLGVMLTSIHGREQDAFDHFAAAVKLDPNDPEARVNLGIGLLQRPGHRQEAIAQLQTAMRLKPDPEVEDLLRKLELEPREGVRKK